MPAESRIRFKGEPWPEADRLFRTDPLWLGSDDAYSVRLSEDRVLWMFGDTFIGTEGSADRRDSTFIRNSIGIQTGLDPSTAKIRFHWSTSEGVPSSFFAAPAGVWYWPLHGVRLGESLLLFMMQVRSTRTDADDPIEDWREEGPLGFFDVFDYAALLVSNPDADPADWNIQPLSHEPSASVIYGASVVAEEGWLYSYGWLERRGYLLRWTLTDAAAGDLMHPEHFTAEGWAPDASLRHQVLADCATEFVVLRDSRSRLLGQIQMRENLGHIAVRSAPAFEGPWTQFSEVFAPEEAARAGVFIYAAKAHPYLTGADLVMTYASNGRDVDETLDDQTIYYPRFVKGTALKEPS